MSNLPEVYDNIRRDIIDAFLNEFVIYVKEILRENVLDEYDKYTPSAYPRRKDKGGMSDVGNYTHTVKLTNDGIILNIYNDTKTDNGEDYLDRYIIEGDKYTWKNSRIYDMQPFPRDFIKATIEDLQNNSNLRKILESKLRKIGVKLK